MVKIKQKQFQARQNKRIPKRERHQKKMNKMMHKMGGRFSVGWLNRCFDLAERIIRKQKKTLTKPKK